MFVKDRGGDIPACTSVRGDVDREVWTCPPRQPLTWSVRILLEYILFNWSCVWGFYNECLWNVPWPITHDQRRSAATVSVILFVFGSFTIQLIIFEGDWFENGIQFNDWLNFGDHFVPLKRKVIRHKQQSFQICPLTQIGSKLSCLFRSNFELRILNDLWPVDHPNLNNRKDRKVI